MPISSFQFYMVPTVAYRSRQKGWLDSIQTSQLIQLCCWKPQVAQLHDWWCGSWRNHASMVSHDIGCKVLWLIRDLELHSTKSLKNCFQPTRWNFFYHYREIHIFSERETCRLSIKHDVHVIKPNDHSIASSFYKQLKQMTFTIYKTKYSHSWQTTPYIINIHQPFTKLLYTLEVFDWWKDINTCVPCALSWLIPAQIFLFTLGHRLYAIVRYEGKRSHNPAANKSQMHKVHKLSNV